MRVFVFFCLIFAVCLGASAQEARRAPGFSLPDSNLRQHDLQDYRGKFVLIEMMKTDCPHCKVFSQTLERAKTRYGNKLAVLSIVHPPDNQNTVKQYIVANKISNPILFDCGQMAMSYVNATGQASASISLPQVWIVDPEGIIRRTFGYSAETKGMFEGNGLFGELDKLINAKK